MDIKTRLLSLLSRKFLAPILALISFMIWQAWLNIIPIEIFATFIGALFGGFLAIEGIRDIIVALHLTKKN